MLSAFTARPLVELKPRDKSRIESVLAYGDRLLVGLNSGSLRVYRVNNDEREGHASGDEGERPRSANKPVELLRELEKFSKYKIDQLALVKEANVLLSLSNAHVHLHDLQEYTLAETLSKSKGASAFAIASHVAKDASSGVNTIVTRLAVAVKRKLLVWTWQDGELDAEVSEQTLVTGIKSLTWASASRIVAGLHANYVIVDVEASTVTDVVGPGSIGGAPGQDGGRLGATGVASMSYLGMSAPRPLATRLAEGEMLLARDINTYFMNLEGNSLGRRQIPWPVAPDAVGYSYPYLLSLQTSKGSLEIRNPQTLTLLQSIALPSATQLHIPQTHTSLAHAGKGFLVLSERAVWRMLCRDYDRQIDELVERGPLDEAISLLGMLEDALLKDKAGRMRDIKMQKAQLLFDEKRFRESIDIFTEVNAPPERVISLFPPFIAGSASTQEGKCPDSSSPLAMSPKSGKSRRSSVRESGAEGKSPGKQSKRLSSKDETASTGSAVVRPPLEGKDLKTATEELRGFLVQSRTRMKRILNPDGSLKRAEADESSTSDLGSLLLKNTFNQTEADREDILHTAKLIDTTLFRAYMFVSPSFAGPLFRIDNFCDPDVVNEKLTGAGRYNDLVDFFYGKQLHRQALDLLERFGNKEPSDVAPQLVGPERTVSYLQSLSAEHVDLILDFAKWPLKTDSELGMQVFLADTENAETLPRERVLAFLQPISSDFALQYLEHITQELNDTTPSFHHALAEIYVRGLQDKDFPSLNDRQAWERKTLRFLRSSTNYTPYKILALLGSDDARLYEARAIVLSTMGQHKQALDIYVFKLQSPEKAEEYCNQVFLANLPKTKAATVSDTDHDETPETNIYNTLLSLYLSPPFSGKKGPHKTNWPAALSLLAKHGARMPASSTLDLMPDTLPVQDLQSYFKGQMRREYTLANESRIVAGLRASEAFRIDAALRMGEEDRGFGALEKKGRSRGRTRRALVEEESVCRVCYRRFGGSAVKVMPDNSVVHYGCATK